MIDKQSKREALEIVSNNVVTETASIPTIKDDSDKRDYELLRDAAWEKELLRREGTLEENERKYLAAEVLLLTDENGNLEEKIVVGTYYWEDGELYVKKNAYGYDLLPPDIQEAYGSREDVVDNYVIINKHTMNLEHAYVDYRKNNEGYKNWEEYRDTKGLGSKDEITLEQAQDVDDNYKPRETPAVDPSTENLITK